MSHPDDEPTRTIITDVHIPFGSMIVLLLKLALAAIPALLILSAVGAFVFALAITLAARP